jgi:hypothetical protein
VENVSGRMKANVQLLHKHTAMTRHPENKDVDLAGINTSAMQQQHVVTHTIRETEVTASIDSWVLKTHILTKRFIHKKKTINVFLLIFS